MHRGVHDGGGVGRRYFQFQHRHTSHVRSVCVCVYIITKRNATSYVILFDNILLHLEPFFFLNNVRSLFCAVKAWANNLLLSSVYASRLYFWNTWFMNITFPHFYNKNWSTGFVAFMHTNSLANIQSCGSSRSLANRLDKTHSKK